MSPLPKPDIYAKGMAVYGESGSEETSNLDRFQYRFLKPFLGKRILELGAGAGRISQLILNDGTNFEHYVVNEPSDFFFKQLSKNLPASAKITLERGETSDLVNRYGGYFDTIFSVHVLEHVEDDRLFIKECLDMLKPGGKVVVLVPALQFLYSNLDRKIGHFRRYDKRMVNELVKGLNARLTKMHYSDFTSIFPSLFFFKLCKIDYQSQSSKKKFQFLAKIYSKYFIPVIEFIERCVPVPFGINLTFILEKD